MIRWGIIGCGGIARRRVLPARTDMRSTRFVAVMDADPDVTRDVAEETGTRACFSLEEILDDPEIQAVYIATPVHLHHPQALLAAVKGKHVLLEKPLALNVEQGREVVETFERKGLLLMEGYMMKFHSLNGRAAEMVARGDLGKPVFLRAQLTCWYPEIPGAWRQDPSLGGGGALMDMATHLFDLLEEISGSSIVEVTALVATQTFSYPVEDSSVTLLGFQNGAFGVVEAFYNIPDVAAQGRLEVYGTQGSILAEGTIGQDPGGSMHAFLSPSEKGYDALQQRAPSDLRRQVIIAPPVNMYAAEFDYFSECIADGRPPAKSSGRQGLHILEVARAAYESARTGRAVCLS
ncbi:MAG: dehydrogenase [Armatimonadota bacterium]|nr:MAG: dehydrogenase [Armatimonadota bacterium]